MVNKYGNGDPIRFKAKMKRATMRRAFKKKEIVTDAKSKPCADCGVAYHPCVMDFDHVRGLKSACVSWYQAHGSYKQLTDEIEKCDVVCSNCHRLRTFARKDASGRTEEQLAAIKAAGGEAPRISEMTDPAVWAQAADWQTIRGIQRGPKGQQYHRRMAAGVTSLPVNL